MLYGYKTIDDGNITTMVVAASTIEELTVWSNETFDLDTEFYNDYHVSGILDVMTKEDYKGYKHPIYAFYHRNDIDRENFIKKHSIEIVPTAKARDLHRDMLWDHEQEAKQEVKQTRKELWDKRDKEIEEAYKVWRADIEARKEVLQKRKDAGVEIKPEDEIPEEDLIFYMPNEYDEKTLEEELGLAAHDPWDRRSEEELEQERIWKEKLEKAKKDGKLSGESFGGENTHEKRKAVDLREPKKVDSTGNANTEAGVAPEQVDVDPGKVYVTKINTTTDSNGNITVTGINAIKKGGEVNEEERDRIIAERQEARSKLSLTPEAFAEALRGTGRMDSTGGAVIAPDAPEVAPSPGKKRKGL